MGANYFPVNRFPENRRFVPFQNSEDAGDPLLLTNYIESGNIATVRNLNF